MQYTLFSSTLFKDVCTNYGTPECYNSFQKLVADSTRFGNDQTFEILFLVQVVVLVIAKYLFAGYVIEFFGDLARIRASPANYTIMLKVPVGSVANLASLKDLCTQMVNLKIKAKEKPVEVLKISPLYNIKDLVDVTQKLLLIEKKIKIKKIRKAEATGLITKKNALREQYKNIKQSYEANIDKYFTRWVCVTFATISDAKRVKNAHHSLLSYLMFYKRVYSYREAPEPSDIIWDNWACTFRARLVRRTIGFLTALVLIAINFGAIIGLKYAQFRITQGSDNSVGLVFFSVCISAVVSGINFLVRWVLSIFNSYEMYRTYSAHFSFIVYKMVWTTFLNISFVVLIVNRVAQKPDERTPLDAQPIARWTIFGASGTTGNMIIVMFVNLVVDVAILFFDPIYLYRLWKRFRVRRRLAARSKSLLQCEANEAFEGEKYELSEFYFICFKTFTVAFFYQVVIPYGLALGAIELFLKFWVIKYVCLRRSQRPVDTNVEFSLNMVKVFELMIGLLVLGFLWFKVVLGSWSVFGSGFVIAITAIGGYEFLFGMKVLRGCYESTRFDAKEERQRTFNENEVEFPYDYDRMNPVTAGPAFQKYVQRLNGGPALDLLKSNQIDPNDVPLNLINNINNFAVRRNNLEGNQRIFKPDQPLEMTQNQTEGYHDIEYDRAYTDNLNPYGIQDINQTMIFANQRPRELMNLYARPGAYRDQALTPVQLNTEEADVSQRRTLTGDPDYDRREIDRLHFLQSWIEPARRGTVSGGLGNTPHPAVAELKPIPFEKPNANRGDFTDNKDQNYFNLPPRLDQDPTANDLPAEWAPMRALHPMNANAVAAQKLQDRTLPALNPRPVLPQPQQNTPPQTFRPPQIDPFFETFRSPQEPQAVPPWTGNYIPSGFELSPKPADQTPKKPNN